MRRSEKPCRVVGVSCGEVTIQYGGTGEITLKSVTALQDEDGNVHGTTNYVGPWPDSVADLVTKLKDEIEAHMETIHFEVKREYNSVGAAAPGEDSKPTGLFSAGLGASGDEADQL